LKGDRYIQKIIQPHKEYRINTRLSNQKRVAATESFFVLVWYSTEERVIPAKARPYTQYCFRSA
jgi:hypothetical protein